MEYPKRTEEIIPETGEWVNSWLESALEGLDDLTGAAGGGGCGGEAAALPPPGLPCLYKNNVTEKDKQTPVPSSSAELEKLSIRRARYVKKYMGKRIVQGYDRKAAQALFLNAGELLQRGVERCAFVTITTPENLSYWTPEGWKAARSRFRSWISHSGGLESVFGPDRDWARVIEPQRRGAIHWHLLIDTGVDIRSGVDLDAFNRGDYRSAGPELRGMWARMRSSCKAYKLGRSSIEPIKSEKWEAAARYVGKYISKGLSREVQEFTCEGKLRPDHARRVGYSSGWKTSNTRFTWLESGGPWRDGVARFAELSGCGSFSDLRSVYGSSWAWHNRDLIRALGSGEPLGEEHLHVLRVLSSSACDPSDPDPF